MKLRKILVAIAAPLLTLGVIVAIPNLAEMRVRAHEGDTKRNMHAVQVSMDSFGHAHSGQYPYAALDLAPYLQAPLVNPWTGRTMTVLIRPGPPVDIGDIRRGSVVVFRPDSARYEILGVDRANRFFPLVLVGGSELERAADSAQLRGRVLSAPQALGRPHHP